MPLRDDATSNHTVEIALEKDVSLPPSSSMPTTALPMTPLRRRTSGELEEGCEGDEEENQGLLGNGQQRAPDTQGKRDARRLVLRTGLLLSLLPTLILLNWTLGLLLGHRFTWSPSRSTFPTTAIWDSPPSAPIFPRFEDDIVLTVRTSATTMMQRLPVMLMEQYTLPKRAGGQPWEYIPNVAYYSDADLWLDHNTHFIDILANVSSDVRSLKDFNSSYTRIQELVRSHQDPAKLVPAGAAKWANQAWLLDKWKFLPLHGDAYRRWPDAKWQVAIEDDTYLFWNQLVKWLKGKPHDEQKFFGSQMYLVNGSLPFAHGGAGYAISRSLLKATYGLTATSPHDFEHQFTHHIRYSCCGDAELFRAFSLTKPSVTLPRPNWEESGRSFRVEWLDKSTVEEGEWCEPVFTVHHVGPWERVGLGRFKWEVEARVGEEDFVRWVDLWDYFASSIVANGTRKAWNAVPGDGVGEPVKGPDTAKGCAEACEKDEACFAWTYEYGHKQECRHSKAAILGGYDATQRTESGWMTKRITEQRKRQWCAGQLGDLAALGAAAAMGTRPN